MVKLSEEEKLIRDTCNISEVPEGGIIEIVFNGKTIVRRKGEEEIERIEEEE